ncbi:hypothetical protein niasHT_017359 [Heterodera trifolii]|uniref:Uncharacterized protein n=1 Tax=Heterodera trifolii TaxID=157864 RepID=A0ABD2L472_9BILA
MKPHFSTKHFVYHVEQLGKRLFTVTYDLKIPSPNFAPGDLFGHLLAQNKLPLPFYKEVRVKFEFVRDETRKFDAKLVALRTENALKTGENLDDSLLGAGANNSADDVVTTNCDSSLKAVTGNADNEAESLFEEQFQHVMRNASMVELSKLITAESRMTEEMRSLVRARNFEVGRIKLTCEQTLAQSVADATEFDKHSYEISMLNEKLRQVSINYSHQIEALNEHQRHEYRQLVRTMYANEKICFPARCNIQSVSAESFTICIGAQLKTMHNVRILTCHQLLVDLLTVHRSNNTSNSINMNANSSTACWHCANNCDNNNNNNNSSTICHSQRLQLLMNLYRRDFACAVLIIVVDGSDPLWHVKEHSKFAQLCEHSAELHFESLERQLKKIESNSSLPRLMISTCNNDIMDDSSEFSQDLYGDHQYTVKGEDNDDYCGDVNSLRPGDMYMTNHSNLSAVQVNDVCSFRSSVFHVVGNRQLVEQDISSRHPCINALRNVIRLAPHSGINHITFLLLLVEHMTETMTISWCLSRAELVFKCLKGFLMEVFSSGMSTAIAGVGGAIIGASGNAVSSLNATQQQ